MHSIGIENGFDMNHLHSFCLANKLLGDVKCCLSGNTEDIVFALSDYVAYIYIGI